MDMQKHSSSQQTSTPAAKNTKISNSPAPLSKKPLVSRRAFLGTAGAAVASLFIKPVPGGFSVAYADEVGITDPIKFTVVSKEEIGIAVADSTTKKPVSNVRVRLTSLANKAQVSETTNESGVAVFNIKALAEDASASTLAFFGSVLVAKEGWRDFETGRMRFFGGTGVGAVIQQSDGRAYARRITFDGWDIQYEANEFAATNDNDVDHEFRVDIGTEPGKSIKLEYWVGGVTASTIEEKTLAATAPQDTFGTAKGIASFAFVHPFLNKKLEDRGYYFAPGYPLKFNFWTDGSNKCQIVTRFKSMLGVIDAPQLSELEKNDPNAPKFRIGATVARNTETGEQAVAEASESSDNLGDYGIDFTFPSAFPFIGGTKMDIWTPEFPVKYNFSPYGTMMLGIGWDVSAYKNDLGKGEVSYWKTTPRSSCADQIQKQRDDWNETFSGYLLGENSKGFIPESRNSWFGTWGKSAKLEFKVSAMAFVEGKYDTKMGIPRWYGTPNAIAEAALTFKAAMQFYIGPIPFMLGFDFKAALSAALTLGCTLPMGVLSLDKTEFSLSKSEFSMALKISVGVSVGIGFSGICSLSVRGAGFIQMGTSYVKLPEGEKYLPHFLINAGIGTSVVAQLFIAKWSKDLYGYNWDVIYGNWKKDEPYPRGRKTLDDAYPEFNSASGSRTLPSGVEGTSDFSTDTGDGFELVSEKELQNTREFNARAKTATIDILDKDARTFSVTSEGETFTATDDTLNWIPQDSSDTFTVDPGSTPVVDDILYSYDYEPFKDGAGVDTLMQCPPITSADQCRGADEFGVKPISDVRVMSHVFSDPRIKISKYNDIPIMFRILPVELPGGKVRSRLTMSQFNSTKNTWEKPIVLEFNHGENNYDLVRSDMFDYDFDICTRPNSLSYDDGTFFRIVVTSGKRPKGDNSNFEEVANNTVFYLLCVTLAGAVTRVSYNYVSGSQKGACAFMPRVFTLYDGGQSQPSVTFVGYMSMKSASADKPKGLYCHIAPVDTFGMIERDKAFVYEIPESVGKLTMFDISDFVLFSYRAGVSGSTTPMMQFAVVHASPDRKSNNLIVGAKAYGGTYFGVHKVANFNGHPVVWPQTPGQLLMKSGTDLQLLKIEQYIHSADSREALKISFTSVAPQGEGKQWTVDRFALADSGKLLYFTAMHDGPGAGGLNSDGTAKPSVPVKLYQVYAARLVEDRFVDVFPFATLSNPADNLHHFDFGNHCAFMYKTITSLAESASDVHFATVPYVRAVTLLNLHAMESVVVQGGKLKINVCVRNDGNVCLSSFKVKVFNNSAQVAILLINTTAEANLGNIMDVPTSVQFDPLNGDTEDSYAEGEGAYATQVAAPVQDEATKNGVLVPGKIKNYIGEMDIPRDWKGVYKLSAVIDDGSYQSARTAGWIEEESLLGAALDFADTEGVQLSLDTDTFVFEDDDFEENNYLWEDDPNPQPPSPKPTDPKPLVRTGDPLTANTFGTIGLAAAAAGAGIVAYSRRRSALEGLSQQSEPLERPETSSDEQ